MSTYKEKRNEHGGDWYSVERENGICAESLLDFSVNLNPLGAPSSLKSIVADSFSDITRYPDAQYRVCREAISAYHSVPADWVCAGNGATEIIYLYCRAVRPRRALVIAPTFSEYRRALEAVGASVHYFQLQEPDKFRLNACALCESIANGYDLVILCNPNNPTGTLCSREDLLIIASSCERSGARLLIDESFIEFVTSSSCTVSLVDGEMPPQIYVIRSLTKLFCIPGLRLGYGVGSDAALNREIALLQEPWSINVFAAKSASMLLSEGDYVDRARNVIAEEKAFLCDALNQISWLAVYPSEANFLLLSIRAYFTATTLRAALLEYNILVRDASNFEFLDERFVRIAVKDRQSNECLLSAFEQISLTLK